MGFRTFLPFQHIKEESPGKMPCLCCTVLPLEDRSTFPILPDYDYMVTTRPSPGLHFVLHFLWFKILSIWEWEKSSEFSLMSAYCQIRQKKGRYILLFSFCVIPASILNTNTTRKLQVIASSWFYWYALKTKNGAKECIFLRRCP